MVGRARAFVENMLCFKLNYVDDDDDDDVLDDDAIVASYRKKN
jgi:hypothetical protein